MKYAAKMMQDLIIKCQNDDQDYEGSASEFEHVEALRALQAVITAMEAR